MPVDATEYTNVARSSRSATAVHRGSETTVLRALAAAFIRSPSSLPRASPPKAPCAVARRVHRASGNDAWLLAEGTADRAKMELPPRRCFGLPDLALAFDSPRRAAIRVRAELETSFETALLRPPARARA